MFASSQNSFVEALAQHGDLWKWGLWELIRVSVGRECGALMMGIVALKEEEEERYLY